MNDTVLPPVGCGGVPAWKRPLLYPLFRCIAHITFRCIMGLDKPTWGNREKEALIEVKWASEEVLPWRICCARCTTLMAMTICSTSLNAEREFCSILDKGVSTLNDWTIHASVVIFFGFISVMKTFSSHASAESITCRGVVTILSIGQLYYVWWYSRRPSVDGRLTGVNNWQNLNLEWVIFGDQTQHPMFMSQ